MRALIATLIALMLFAATPAAAGDCDPGARCFSDFEKGLAAYYAGDYQKAVRLLKPLAEQGDFWAQFKLGEMYRKGEGTPQDDVKAVHWYSRSGAQGWMLAQFHLGVMHAKGWGVPKNNVAAYALFSITAVQGYEGGKKTKK